MQIILMKNVLLTRIVSTLFVFFDLLVTYRFLTYVFNMHLPKSKLISLFTLCSLLEFLSIWNTSVIISPILNIFIIFICITIFYQIDLTQKMFILFLPFILFQWTSTLLIFLISNILSLSPTSIMSIPLFKFIILWLTYTCICLILRYLRTINISKVFNYKLDFSNKLPIFFFSMCSFASVLLTYIFLYKFKAAKTIIYLIVLNIFFILLLITLIAKIFDLVDAKNTIDYERTSYKFLSNSYDSIRSFKHDFSNIMQSIGGYIVTDDLSGLKKYYSSIFKDCSELSKLAIFDKNVLNSPPVLSLVAEKYLKAKELGINFNIEVFVDLNELNIDIYEFTRILGIFLDNSIEAASSSYKKVINIILSKDYRNRFILLTVENSCDSKKVDTLKIFEKNYSTKPKNTGLGLWKVKNILNKYDNVYLNTSLKNNLFRHQMKIYY